MNKKEWMKKIEAFRKSTAFVLDIDPSWRAPNGWGKKDLFSHLLSWDLEYRRSLESKEKKKPVDPFVPAFIQQEKYSEEHLMEFLAHWNDNQVEKGREYSLEEAKSQFERTRQNLIDCYESLWVVPDGLTISPGAATHLVDDLCVHDMKHARKFIPPEKISST